MSRSVPEWIGKSDDTPVPRHVKARVFEAHGGICHLSRRKITAADKWDCDHIRALINGGENRESNLAPALRDKHREKTVQDVKLKSKAAANKARHLGLKKRSSFGNPRLKRRVDGTVVPRQPQASEATRGR